MSWIKTLSKDEAEGELKAFYNAYLARARTERVANVVKVSSVHPRAMAAHLELYKALMFLPSPLSRTQREMIAAVVSKSNGCHY